MQLEQIPAEEILEESYEAAESSDYVEEEAGQRATAAAILEQIERHRNPGRLLDLGCWVGFFPAEAAQRGWSATGVEPSRFASTYAREKLGVEVISAGLFDAELPESTFDVVFLGDVVEHLPDPAEAVRRIGSLLAPEGLLVMALPDAGSRLARSMGRRWWSVIPTHVHYFTRRSMHRLLSEAGFDVLEMRTQPKTFTVGYYLDRLGGYSEGVRKALRRGAHVARLEERLWAPDFRDRMLVVAALRPGSGPASG
jgi:SAM-dependent methyltransferase